MVVDNVYYKYPIIVCRGFGFYLRTRIFLKLHMLVIYEARAEKTRVAKPRREAEAELKSLYSNRFSTQLPDLILFLTCAY